MKLLELDGIGIGRLIIGITCAGFHCNGTWFNSIALLRILVNVCTTAGTAFCRDIVWTYGFRAMYNFPMSMQTNDSFTALNENLIDARLVIKSSNSLKISVNFSVEETDFSECFISRMVF